MTFSRVIRPLRPAMFALLGVLAVGAANVEADLFYHFDQSNYFVQPGGTVDVSLFLRETGTTMTGPSGPGFASIGTRVHLDDPPVPTEPAEVTSVAENSDFDSATIQFDVDGGNNVDIGLTDFGNPGPTAQFVSGALQILIANLTFIGGSNPGEVTNLRAAETSFDDIVLTDGTVLDAHLTGDAQATITVVPEPSAALFGLVACGMLGAGRLVVPRLRRIASSAN